MGRGKKIWIGIGVAIGIFIVIGIASSAANLKGNDKIQDSNVVANPTETLPANASTKIITRSLSDLLPTRQDIGTEWRIGSTSNSTEGLVGVKGFVETLQQTYSKSDGGNNLVTQVGLDKFDSSTNAKSFYDDKVSKIKSEGGYKEYEVNSINAECYGTFSSGTFTGMINYYCVSSNIYYRVFITGDLNSLQYDDDVKQQVNSFPKTIAYKIEA